MPAAVIHCQALIHADGSLFGYAVHARVEDEAGLLTPTAEDRLVSSAYARVDLAQVVGDRAVVLRATAPMLRGEEEIPAAPRSLVVEVPAPWVENEYAEDALVAMRELGFGVALASYTGTLAQRALLPLLGSPPPLTSAGGPRVCELCAGPRGCSWVRARLPMD